ncbi:hypothetical protein TrVGV298_007239 [Trichoderma virens]|nr:hypothetical protein TrVGV298_007239 [Trichoderma virens]
MSAVESVSNLVQQCLEKFHEAITDTNDIDYQDQLKTRLARFSSWIDNVEAKAKSSVSLDSSFQLHCLEILSGYFNLLSIVLNEHLETGSKGHNMAETLFNIDSLIRGMEEIMISIPSTGEVSRSRRVNKSFNLDDFKRYLECWLGDQSAEDYFEDEDSADSSQRQPDQTRPSTARSDLSSGGLDNQNNPADGTQLEIAEQFLIESGADMNIEDHDGLTALHMAIKKGDGKIIRALLFPPNAYQGFTDDQVQGAISWAKEQKHISAAGILSDLWTRYQAILSFAQETFNIEDRTAAAGSIIQGDDWYALIDPLLEPVYFSLVDTLQRGSVSSTAFIYNGKYIATCDSNGIRQLFDLEIMRDLFPPKLDPKLCC